MWNDDNWRIQGEKSKKNGNVHEYVYYHCTKKSKLKCPEPCIRQEELDRQLSSLIQKFSLRLIGREKCENVGKRKKLNPPNPQSLLFRNQKQESAPYKPNSSDFLTAIWNKTLSAKSTVPKKQNYFPEKKSLEEQLARIEQKRTGWPEPMAEWIKEAENLPKIARESNLFAKKVTAKEIFGSNLVLAGREARQRAEKH